MLATLDPRARPSRRRPTVAVLAATVGVAAVAGGARLDAQGPAQRGTAVVAGVVTDTLRNAVARAEVLLSDGKVVVRTTRTGDDGAFSLDALPSGTLTLTIRRIGFRPRTEELQLRPDVRKQLAVSLSPMPTELDGVLVLARTSAFGGRLRDFYQRKERTAWGYYFTPDDLERMKLARPSDVLRQVPGVRLVHDPAVGYVAFLSSDSSGRPGTCAMPIYRNGVRVAGPRLLATTRQTPQHGLSLDEFLDADDLAAVEVYKTAEGRPMEITQHEGKCGAIVVWTKRPGDP